MNIKSLNRAIFLLVLYLFLFGIYSNLGVYIGSVFIPSFLPLVLSLIVLFLYGSDFISKFRSEILFAFLVVLLSIFLGHDSEIIFLKERIKSFFILVYSVFISYQLLFLISKEKNNGFSKIFYCFSIFILIGSFLEVFTPFRIFSYAYSSFFSGNYLYSDFNRDIKNFFFIRPILFTNEPSDVAKFFILSLNLWFITTDSKRKKIKFLIFFSIGLFIIRSPILSLLIPIYLISIFFESKNNFKNIISRPTFIILLFMVMFLFVSFFHQRVSNIVNFKDQSANVRIFSPIYVAYETLHDSPFFGVGIGGKESTYSLLESVYSTLGINIPKDKYTAKYNNYFWEIFIYFGLVGSFFLYIIFSKLLSRFLFQTRGMFLCFFLIYSQTFGGINSVRFWCYMFLIGRAVYIFELNLKKQSVNPSHKKRDFIFLESTMKNVTVYCASPSQKGATSAKLRKNGYLDNLTE